MSLLNMSMYGQQPGADMPPRKRLYSNVLSSLRTVMIERMVKPEEVSQKEQELPK